MLKVSAQILWIFTNHLVNFWVQCTSQTKCSSAVYIYTYTSHETEFGLQKPQQQSSRSGVNCEWCLRATWMIFETRGARHESLQREGAEITCGWFWFWCRSNKSATDPTDQLYNVPICRKWRSISSPNTITLSTFILSTISLNWSHFDLNHGSELIEENVINASLRIWIRKYEKIHHNFRLHFLESIQRSLIDPDQVIDGWAAGCENKVHSPRHRQTAPPGCQSWLARAQCSADALAAPKMHLNASSSQWTMHSVQLALPLISCNWLKKSWHSWYSILHREWLNDKGGVKVDYLSFVIFAFSWGTSWERDNCAVNCNLVLHIQRSGLHLW